MNRFQSDMGKAFKYIPVYRNIFIILDNSFAHIYFSLNLSCPIWFNHIPDTILDTWITPRTALWKNYPFLEKV